MANDYIIFSGLGRMRDQLVLASIYDRIASQEKSEIEALFQNILLDALSKFSPGGRDKRLFNTGTLYFIADKDICCLYAVAVRKNYPERLAFQFLKEMEKIIITSEDCRQLSIIAPRTGVLNKNLRKPIKDLMDRFDEPSNFDKTSEVQGKVEHVKGIMQENINKVIATHADLSDLESKTNQLNIGAQEFQRTSADVHKVFWLQKIKITILLGLVSFAIIAYIIVIVINFAS